jgi:hypothetical protein
MSNATRDAGEAPGMASRPSRITEIVPPDDPSIPVLTERLTLPPLDLNLDFQLPPAAPATAPAPSPRPSPPPAAPQTELVASWSEDQALELRESILLGIARNLPLEVEEILRRHLDAAVEEATRRFASAVRLAIAATLREIVERAVQAELQRLRAQGAPGGDRPPPAV